jgi:hypothetical protein
MGWASGSELMTRSIEAVLESVPDAEARRTIYLRLIAAYQDGDCDTLADCLGIDPAYDQAYYEVDPPDPCDRGYEAGYGRLAGPASNPYPAATADHDRWEEGRARGHGHACQDRGLDDA